MMTTSISKSRPIECLAGVATSVDDTPANTEHYIDSLGIRFVGGKPEKTNGSIQMSFDNGNTVIGVPRSCYSQTINGKIYTMVGTHKRLYSIIGSALVNITPLKDTQTTVGTNSLLTDYVNLANNPATMVSGSNTVTIAKTDASRYRAGDVVTLSGFVGTINGTPSAELNAVHIVRTVSASSFTIRTTTAATSSATGGGAGVYCASGLIQFTNAAHGLEDGDRVNVIHNFALGGILAVNIHKQHIIRVTGANTFDFMTTGTATSSATNPANSAHYNEQIDAGEIDVKAGAGYGVGRYGVGLYGTSRPSASGVYTYPRIWCFDRFGALILCSPCNGSYLYEWDGDIETAPVRVTNSPDGINWFFVDQSIIVALGTDTGGGLIENRITTSDQNDRTVWTGTAENQVFDDAIEGAGRFVSALNVRGTNLLFTFNQVYSFEYIGGTNVWSIRKISSNSGIVGPMACKEVNGVGFWVGQQNFYMFSGSNVQIMPSATSYMATNGRYSFAQLSTLQRYKSFCRYNEQFSELDFHFPSQASGEVDLVSRCNLIEQTWANDEIERTCAESPSSSTIYQKMCDYDGNVYQHDYGYDDAGNSKPFSFTTRRLTLGKKETRLSAFVPDGVQSGTVTVTIHGYQWAQSQSPIDIVSFTVDPTTGRCPVNINGRYWTYTIEGNSLGQAFSLGNWQEELQESGNGA